MSTLKLRQLPLPMGDLNTPMIYSLGRKSFKTRNAKYLVDHGECGQCASRLCLSEEAYIVYNSITGELRDLRCGQCEPTEYTIGPNDVILSVDVYS